MTGKGFVILRVENILAFLVDVWHGIRCGGGYVTWDPLTRITRCGICGHIYRSAP